MAWGSQSTAAKVAVIVNGRSRRAARKWRAAVERLPPHTRVIPIADAGSIESVVRQLVDDAVTEVIVAGGDGTINAVVNGMLACDAAHLTLGVLPLGSANDFAYGLRCARDTMQRRASWSDLIPFQVALVIAGQARRYFCNVMGVGWTACIARRAERWRTACGRGRYLAALAASWCCDVNGSACDIQVDDQALDGPLLACCLALGPREGGRMLSPTAVLGEDRLQVMHVADLGRWTLLRYLPGVWWGRFPVHDHRIRRRAGRHVTLTTAGQRLEVHLDGELFEVASDVTKLEVQLLPRRLQARLYEVH